MTTPADAAAPGAQVGAHDATAALAAATRELVLAIRLADAPEGALREAQALVEQATALVAPHRVDDVVMQGALRPSQMELRNPEGVTPAAFFPYSPVVGPLNPISPLIDLHFDGDRVRGTAAVDAPYAGPPGMVHGGIIALIFDEVLGSVNVCHGLGAFTGTLNVRYERPTPLRGELELEGWIDRVEGRKVFTHGTIRHDGEVTARAEGIFIRTDPPDLDRLQG